MKIMKHEFVKFIPNDLEQNVLYISVEFCTAVHLCVCGCRNKVVTPLSKHDWSITFNGESVSLYPSIGNWSFNCQSHYWIIQGKVKKAKKWKKKKIDKMRFLDRESRAKDSD